MHVRSCGLLRRHDADSVSSGCLFAAANGLFGLVLLLVWLQLLLHTTLSRGSMRDRNCGRQRGVRLLSHDSRRSLAARVAAVVGLVLLVLLLLLPLLSCLMRVLVVVLLLVLLLQVGVVLMLVVVVRLML